jgi:Spherulation-specific family 4
MKLVRALIIILMLTCITSCRNLSAVKQQSSLRSIEIHERKTNSDSQNQMQIVDRSSHDPKLQILLPLYIYPNWYEKDKYVWKQVAIAAKKVPIVAIVNPNSGPNNAPPNRDYQQGIKDLHQAGIKIIGYVSTNYAKRDLQAVKADIDLYIKYFKIDGIFIDEAANTRDKLNYYHQLSQHIKSHSPQYLTIVNPGTDVDESYLHQPIADVIVIFENQQKNWSNYHPPLFTKKYPPEHFAALVHTTANRKLMKSTIDRAVKYKFGYVYITNDSPNTTDRNPWDSLPEYWQAQVNYIQKLNASNHQYR